MSPSDPETRPLLHRPFLGIPLCCWPSAAWWLFKGIAWGWAVVLFTQPYARRLIWKSWYWPGFIHPWRYTGEPCPHGVHKP